MRERIKAAIAKWRDTGKGLDMVMLLQEQLKQSPDGNVERIRDMLLQRSMVGLKKYGAVTAESNLGVVQWLQHLQEELLDAAVYVEVLKQRAAEAETAGESDAG